MSGRSLLSAVATIAALSVAVTSSASAAPFVRRATLTASDEIGHGGLGAAVALSRDGDTALVGGPQDNNGIGAAWVFTRSGSTWTEQAKLTGEGEVGAGAFGASVALSSDGKTALIGGPADAGGLGAAWVLTRSGSNWRQRGAKLTGKDAGGAQQEAHCDRIGGAEIEGSGTYCFVGHPAGFGASVALSADDTTALIGGPGDNEGDGAAWVFTRSGSTWKQRGEKLTGGGEQNEFRSDGGYRTEHTGGSFGESVALSSGGDTALIGGPNDHTEYYEGGYDESGGAVWTFTRSGSAWVQQGEKLVGEYSVGLGAAIALSPGGDTALIGSSTLTAFNPSIAAVFTRSGSTWTQQSELGSEYEVEEGFNAFARGLALSSDGSTALVNGLVNGKGFESVPAADVFTRSGATWIEQVPVTLEAPPGACGFLASFGRAASDCGVALSADASTALVGTAVFSYAPIPSVTSVTPNFGRQPGGTTVALTGRGFTHATAVKFGDVNAASFSVNSDTSITAVSPPGGGTVSVIVTGMGATSAISAADQFVYSEPPAITSVNPDAGSPSGGTTVNVTGAHFTGATAVKFGPSEATSFTVNSDTWIQAVSPPGRGIVDVIVTRPDGVSEITPPDQFSYGPPLVTSLEPDHGPHAGGTAVHLTGGNFTGATAVKFGSVSARSFTVNADSSLTAVSPAQAGASTVDVTVTNLKGSSAISSADRFAYTPIVTGITPHSGPQAGGTAVTITGVMLGGLRAVRFGATEAEAYAETENRITAFSPAGTGTVDVTVTTVEGTSATSTADQFSYVAPSTLSR